jgi:hypothetical protein
VTEPPQWGLALLILAVLVLAACAVPVHRWLDRRAIARGATAHNERADRLRAEQAEWEDLVRRLTREDRPK